jgi:hypothetical protein
MCYRIEERNEKWGLRFDIYRNGSLITTSESRSDAEGYIEWHNEKEKVNMQKCLRTGSEIASEKWRREPLPEGGFCCVNCEVYFRQKEFVNKSKVSWQPIDSTTPTGWGNYFMVRVKGEDPRRGKLWLPSIVQRVDDKYYVAENELTPVYFGQDEPENSPFYVELEWRPIPE